MSVLPVPRSRVRRLDSPAGLEFVLPPKRNLFVLLFLPVWLCGWLAGEVAATWTLVTGAGAMPGAPIGFLLLWLTLWTFGGGFALTVFFWMAAGKERVILDQTVLRIRREVFGIGRTRAFDLQHVTRLRLSPYVPRSSFLTMSPLDQLGLSGGIVAFDYGAKAFRFGSGLEEPEGLEIIEEFARRQPAIAD